MVKKLYPEEAIQNIAAAIREKNGTSTTYKVHEMRAAILAIADELFPHADIPEYVKNEALSVAKKVAAK